MEGPAGAFEVSRLFATLIPGRVSGRPQLGSQEIKNRRHREHNSIYFKFPRGRVRENPDDGDNRERGHDFHSGKIEGLSAVGANVALHQKPAGGAAEQIHQENGDVGKHGQFSNVPVMDRAKASTA